MRINNILFHSNRKTKIECENSEIYDRQARFTLVASISAGEFNNFSGWIRA